MLAKPEVNWQLDWELSFYRTLSNFYVS